MATLITTSIHIPAPAAAIWSVLMDFEQYPEWNPFIRSISGKATTGEKLTVKLQPNPKKKAMIFHPEVLASKPHREFRWLGHLWFKGLFDGEHRFFLEANEDGSTTFIHEERFTGILVPLLKKMLENDTKTGFVRMNEALRDRVKQGR